MGVSSGPAFTVDVNNIVIATFESEQAAEMVYRKLHVCVQKDHLGYPFGTAEPVGKLSMRVDNYPETLRFLNELSEVFWGDAVYADIPHPIGMSYRTTH